MPMPNSRQKPRSALIREVRVAIPEGSRAVQGLDGLLPIDFTRTGTMSAQRAASSSTSASAASVLLRLT
jgi:hypothetical protein